MKTIDQVGRVVIPKEVRERAGIQCGMPLEFYADRNTRSVVIRALSCAEQKSVTDDASIAELRTLLLESLNEAQRRLFDVWEAQIRDAALKRIRELL